MTCNQYLVESLSEPKRVQTRPGEQREMMTAEKGNYFHRIQHVVRCRDEMLVNEDIDKQTGLENTRERYKGASADRVYERCKDEATGSISNQTLGVWSSAVPF